MILLSVGALRQLTCRLRPSFGFTDGDGGSVGLVFDGVGVFVGADRLRRGMEELLHPSPPRLIYEVLRSSRASQALAARQSRRMVASETWSSWAVSLTSSPPKNRLSTISA